MGKMLPEISPNILSATEALRDLRAERDRYRLNARNEACRIARELLAQHEEERERGILRRKTIALTFDDDSHPKFTQMVETFQRRGYRFVSLKELQR